MSTSLDNARFQYTSAALKASVLAIVYSFALSPLRDSGARFNWGSPVMKEFKVLLLATLLGLLCITAPAFGQNFAEVTILDERTPDGLEGHRDSGFSAIRFLPENSVKPGPVIQLKQSLSERANQPVSLVISEMRVIDYFPQRIKAGPGGWLTDAIMKSLVNSETDWSLVESLGISHDEDSVICLLAGTMNGEPITVAAHTPYKLGTFSVMVRSDKNFKAAVASTIDKVAQEIIDHQATDVPDSLTVAP